MEIVVSSAESVPVFKLKGRLDGYGASLFDQKAACLSDADRYVIIDMPEVDYLSSSGIRSLVKLEKSSRQKGGRIVVVSPSSFALQVLKTIGLLNRLSVAHSLEEALQAVKGFERTGSSQSHVSVGKRAYTIRTTPGASCALDLWGSTADAAGAPLSADRLIGVSLAELGIAFGIGGFGSSRSQAVEALGELFCTGKIAGVIPADGHCMSDFVLSDDPSETTVYAAAAIALSGMPGIVASPDDASSFSLGELVQDLLQIAAQAGEAPAVMAGVVILAEAASIVASHFQRQTDLHDGLALQREAAEGGFRPGAVLIVGIAVRQSELKPAEAAMLEPILAQLRSSTGSAGIVFHGHALLLDRLPEASPDQSLDERLRQLTDLDMFQAVAHIEPQSTLSAPCAWVYTPSSLRSGAEKMLRIELEGESGLPEEWDAIIRRIYSDAGRVAMSRIHGGYMSSTFRVISYDRDGRKMLPTVLKIGSCDLTNREVAAYRSCVEKYILNNATTIMGSASQGDWAGLRYNFLGITGPDSTISWLTDHYMKRPVGELIPLFRTLFTRVLKPWYGQPKWETIRPYTEHDPTRIFKRICEDAEKELSISPETEIIYCPELGLTLPNPYHFLKYQYPARRSLVFPWYRSITHGDLNMQNVLVDEKDNLYVIDFSETRHRNIIADFARLEPILKFELTKLDGEKELRELLELETGLARPSIIGEPPSFTYRGADPMVEKAYIMICLLREMADRVTLFEESIIPYLLAVLEWTLPVVSYRSANALQKRLSAYSAAMLVQRIMEIERDQR